MGVNGGIFNPSVTIPASYVDGTVITSRAIFTATGTEHRLHNPVTDPCSGLGFNPNPVLTWSWGPEPDESFTINTTPSVIPAPAALPSSPAASARWVCSAVAGSDAL